MPQLTLVLGRKPMQAYNLDQPTIRIGRDGGMDIVIDNPSVSRQQAELRKEGDAWVVADLGSANGTFLNGKKIASPQPLKPGDEIGVGKFSVLFEKAVVVPEAAKTPAAAAVPAGEPAGTMHIKAHEVTRLLKDYSKQRRAQINWESGGQKGTHYFSDQSAVLIGTDELCDIYVPKAPKHHVLVIRKGDQYEVRYLAMFGSMKVGGSGTKKARLQDGGVVEVGGLKLTFVGDLGGD